MPDTVDDFMRRFASGGGTVDDVNATRFHDRFVSTDLNDSYFDNRTYHQAATQYLGQLPDDQFQDAARNAVAQAPPEERAGLLDGLLSALGGSAGASNAGTMNAGPLAAAGGARRDRQDAGSWFDRPQPDERRRCSPGHELHSERTSGTYAKDRRRKTVVCESDGQSRCDGRSDGGCGQTLKQPKEGKHLAGVSREKDQL